MKSIQERLRDNKYPMRDLASTRHNDLQEEAANVIDGLVEALDLARDCWIAPKAEEGCMVAEDHVAIIDTALAAVKGEKS